MTTGCRNLIRHRMAARTERGALSDRSKDKVEGLDPTNWRKGLWGTGGGEGGV